MNRWGKPWEEPQCEVEGCQQAATLLDEGERLICHDHLLEAGAVVWDHRGLAFRIEAQPKPWNPERRVLSWQPIGQDAEKAAR
jgi:hypothetical protein